jgi:formamidopyrimidine-DNA glycosylase
MPELAEVDYFRKQWNPGLKQKIEKVEVHAKKRIFRGHDAAKLVKALTGATLERSEARGKQMLFVAKKGGMKARAWLGLHLGMTGKLRVEKADFSSDRHDHLVLRQKKQALVFQDARMFGRVLFEESADEPAWWARLPPDLLSSDFSVKALADFLRRRGKAPLKADEILWRAAIHPKQLAGDLDTAQTKALYREIRWVCREALRIIGEKWDDPPDSWLFNHRWQKGGTCPRTGAKLQHATIGGRTTCWSPARQKLK